MFFELINAFVNFQAYINKVLHEYFDIFTFAYMNDILIYTNADRTYADDEELLQKHISQMKLILEKFRKHDLYIKFNKCKFHTKKVNFLKFLISCHDISMQVNRVFFIKDWPELVTHFQMQVFLKFANFYKRFIEDFSRMFVDLISLLKDFEKGKFKIKLMMTFENIKSFQKFKAVFTIVSFLRHFEIEAKILLKTNAFDYVVSENLSQLIENQK